MKKKVKSLKEIEEIRKSIWDISPEDYKKKVEEEAERRREYEKRLEQKRIEEDFLYRIKYKWKNLFKK